MQSASKTDDYYAILRVSSEAGQREIALAYREQVKQHHPDRNPGFQLQSTERVKAINEAYEVLNDPGRRAAYDQRRARSLVADPDFLRLERLRDECMRSLHSDQEPDRRFIAASLLSNVFTWQFEVAETLCAYHGEDGRRALGLDTWAAAARPALVNTDKLKTAAAQLIGAQRIRQVTMDAQLRWQAMVGSMSPAFQQRYRSAVLAQT
jgi:curved DNA-binding protein CbpA